MVGSHAHSEGRTLQKNALLRNLSGRSRNYERFYLTPDPAAWSGFLPGERRRQELGKKLIVIRL
jgi:hypothetical protein